MAGSQLEALTSPVAKERWKYSRFDRYQAALSKHAAALSVVVSSDEAAMVTEITTLPDALLPPSAAYPLVSDTRAAAAAMTHIAISAAAPVTVRLVRHAGASACFIDLASGAEATVELLHKADNPSHGCLFIRVGPNAQLCLSHSLKSQAALSWSYLGIDLERDSQLSLQQTLLGTGEHRLEGRLRLLGAGAEATVSGASLAAAQARFDQQLTMEHVAPHCRSTQNIHCAVGHDGRSTVNGRIHIHPGAAGSEAELSNRNLLLSDKAEINSKPELEIYADDVRCSHGSTVGALDPAALFLLQARGIPPALARRLLLTGFLKQVMRGSLAEEDQAALGQQLEQAW